jgi:hypothetical protein
VISVRLGFITFLYLFLQYFNTSPFSIVISKKSSPAGVEAMVAEKLHKLEEEIQAKYSNAEHKNHSSGQVGD